MKNEKRIFKKASKELYKCQSIVYTTHLYKKLYNFILKDYWYIRIFTFKAINYLF